VGAQAEVILEREVGLDQEPVREPDRPILRRTQSQEQLMELGVAPAAEALELQAQDLAGLGHVSWIQNRNVQPRKCSS
jgi:hypothetical protein